MGNFTEYLKGDTPPVQRGKSSTSQRVTLAPNIPASDLKAATYFHRALALRNYLTDRADTFDDLTIDQQKRVREVARQLRAKDHPCAH
jgi:hypothetical protein